MRFFTRLVDNKRGFSLFECVIYILCLTVVFGLMGEFVSRFYFRIATDMSSVQGAVDSFVCFNQILYDLRHLVARGTVKKIDSHTTMLYMDDGVVSWILKNGRLYRCSHRIGNDHSERRNGVSLMMKHVASFDIYTELSAWGSFMRVVLRFDNPTLDSYEQCVALRRGVA